MEEVWKKIIGFDKYEVSNFGRVKALEKEYVDAIGRTFHVKERVLSTKTRYRHGKIDYSKVKIVDNNGNVKNVFVHRLVADAFIPNDNNYPEVNHIDLDKSNNNVNNLEWVTRKENCNKCIQRPHNGETNKNHKLTSEIVKEMRDMWANGSNFVSTARQVGLKYGITISSEQVSNIVKRKQWKHI